MVVLFISLTVTIIILLIVLIVLLITRMESTGKRKEGEGGFPYQSLEAAVRPTCFYVVMENCQNHQQFRAVLNPESVIGRTVLGASNLNQVSIGYSNYISRKHCCLFQNSGTIYIRNMSETSRTEINGVPVQTQDIIKVGDVLLLGDTKMLIKSIAC